MSIFYDVAIEKNLNFDEISAAFAKVCNFSQNEVVVQEPFSIEAFSDEAKLICYARYISGDFSTLVTINMLKETSIDTFVEIITKLATVIPSKCIMPVPDDPNPCTVLLVKETGMVNHEYLNPIDLEEGIYTLSGI